MVGDQLGEMLKQVGWPRGVSEVGSVMGAVALPGAKAWRSRDLCLGSDRHGELIERDGHPPVVGSSAASS